VLAARLDLPRGPSPISPVQEIPVVKAPADGGVGHNVVGHPTNLSKTFLGFGDRYADVRGFSVQSRSHQGHRHAEQAPRPVAEGRVGSKTHDGQFPTGPKESAWFTQRVAQRLVVKDGHEGDDVEALIGGGEVLEVGKFDGCAGDRVQSALGLLDCRRVGIDADDAARYRRQPLHEEAVTTADVEDVAVVAGGDVEQVLVRRGRHVDGDQG